ncbi:MAG TPA: RNA polymerase sigma factor [Polyangiales bacterium]
MIDVVETSIDALMARLARGDRSAFEPLFRALHPRALRLARARLPPHRADDVAQAAMLNVFAHAHRFVPSRPALPWFYAIVSNEIRATRRQARRYEPIDEPDQQQSDHTGAEDALLERELLMALEQAILTLDDQAAQAIRAQLGEAARPPLPPMTYRKRVSRAYARLRLLLGDLR